MRDSVLQAAAAYRARATLLGHGDDLASTASDVLAGLGASAATTVDDEPPRDGA